jgi:enoyl-CoA hydratase
MTEEENEDAKRAAIVVETRSATTIARINRPAERNSLSIATLEELDAIVSGLTVRRDVSAIIFTGTGDVFASGADLRELSCLTPATAREFALRGQRLFQKIADAEQLTIAAINGYCMGGGLDLALSCDVRCASPGAVFAHPGARRGIITGWGGTQRLPRLIGTARAIEMFTTASRLDGCRANEIGLVNHLVDDPLDFALHLASEAEAAGRTRDY